jgi:hypothetical protein
MLAAGGRGVGCSVGKSAALARHAESAIKAINVTTERGDLIKRAHAV